MASPAYSEQVGIKRQAGGSQGDIVFLYALSSAMISDPAGFTIALWFMARLGEILAQPRGV